MDSCKSVRITVEGLEAKGSRTKNVYRPMRCVMGKIEVANVFGCPKKYYR